MFVHTYMNVNKLCSNQGRGRLLYKLSLFNAHVLIKFVHTYMNVNRPRSWPMICVCRLGFVLVVVFWASLFVQCSQRPV